MTFVALPSSGETARARLAAAAFVALASASDKKAEVSAALARKALADLAAKYAEQAGKFFESANKDALALLTQVVQNNPGKTPKQIMARPDVAEVVTAPYKAAAVAAEKVMREAVDAATADTVKRLRSEFKSMGQSWEGVEPDAALLDKLVADLHANAKAMRARYLAAMKDRSTFAAKAQGIANDVVRRARYSTSGAVGDAASTTRTDAFAKAGLNLMWLSRLDSITCTECRRLHGTVIGPGGEFPHGSLKVYGGFLGGPPAHPNCRCVLVGTTKTVS